METLLSPIQNLIGPIGFDYLLVGLGLLCLFFGGESLIKGAISLATKLGLSRLMIGLTIVGIGTSMPELMVSVQSAMKGSPEIAIGNVVGSNIANILLIMGIGAIMYPMAAKGDGLRRDALVMVGASVVLVILGFLKLITPIAGTIMLLAMLAYLVALYFLERGKPNTDTPDEGKPLPPLMAVLWCLAGLVLLVVGADGLVTGATRLARASGISEAVIGLTLVAVGTSLPELTVTIIAALRRQGEVSLGNLIGSNIFNALGILGAASFFAPLPISPHMANFDIPVALGVAVILALVIFGLKNVGRLTGFAFLGLYGAYLAWLFATG
jgi:cation:H+ antiporter